MDNQISGLCPLCGYEFHGGCTCGWTLEELVAFGRPAAPEDTPTEPE